MKRLKKFQLLVFSLAVMLVVSIMWQEHVAEESVIRIDYYLQILNGVAPAPLHTRLLVPYTVDWIAKLMPQDYLQSMGIANNLLTAMSLLGWVLITHDWFKLYLKPVYAFTATTFMVATFLVAKVGWVSFSWTPIEALFTMFILYALTNRRRPSVALKAIIVVLMILGAFNRITSVFGVMMLFVGAYYDPTWRKTAVISAVVWAVITAGLQLYAPGLDRPEIWSIWYTWYRNTTVWAQSNYAVVISWLGAGWYFAIRNTLNLPTQLRVYMLIAWLYILPNAVYGTWWEIRLLMPMLPLYVLAIFYMDDATLRSRESDRL